MDQLLETAEAFVRCRGRWPRGGKVGAITVSGGEISLIGDLADGLSLSFPPLSEGAETELRRRLPSFTSIGNPLDAWGSGDLGETYPACLEVMAKEEGIDLIVVSQDSPPGMAEKQVDQYADVARAAVRTAALGKPVVAFSHLSGGLDRTIKGILDQGNVPFLQGTKESLLSIDRLVKYGQFLRRRKERENGFVAPPPSNLSKMVQGLRGPRRILPDGEAKEILRVFGIPVSQEVLVQTVEEALDALKAFPGPVALKGQSAEIPHKTEAGLVELNVRCPEGLRTSYERITGSASCYKPGVHSEGILVQQMVPKSAVEVILGVSRDSSFGPVIVYGLGGVWVELLKDTTLRIPPVDPEEARTMISEIKGRSLLEGFRGSERVDIESLVSTIVEIGQMAIHLKDVLFSVDLNPLMVLPGKGGVRVVDVVMEVGEF